jgi:copper homeostasis protein
MIDFELAVQDVPGLTIAARLGVDRIELCSALPVGGVTPSAGLIETAVATPGMPPVHVLVRPRLGGFDYAPDETALIVRDVRFAVAAGAAGVVIGGVRAGRVDEELVRRVLEVAGGRDVTFHRAFDTLADLAGGLRTLAALGVRRVLTSAGAAAVADALSALAGLVTTAGDRIEVMAGGGVRPADVERIRRTGVPAIHASAKRTVPSPVGVTLGTAARAGEGGFETTDEAEVARFLAALRPPKG